MTASPTKYPTIINSVGCDVEEITEILWCFGGYNGVSSLTTVYSFDGDTFISETPMTASVFNTAEHCVIIKNIAYLLNWNTYSIITYNIMNGAFNNSYSNFPIDLRDARLASNYIDMLYIGCSYLDIHIYSFNITSNNWKLITPNTTVSHVLGSLVYFDNKLIVIGGSITSSKLEYLFLNQSSSYITSNDQHILQDYFIHFSVVVLNNGVCYILGLSFCRSSVLMKRIINIHKLLLSFLVNFEMHQNDGLNTIFFFEKKKKKKYIYSQ